MVNEKAGIQSTVIIGTRKKRNKQIDATWYSDVSDYRAHQDPTQSIKFRVISAGIYPWGNLPYEIYPSLHYKKQKNIYTPCNILQSCLEKKESRLVLNNFSLKMYPELLVSNLFLWNFKKNALQAQRHNDTPVFNDNDKGKEPNKLFGANPDSNVEFIHFCFRTIFVYHSVFIFAWDLFYSVFFQVNHQESFLLCWHTNMLNNMFID